MRERMIDRATTLMLWFSVIYFGAHFMVYLIR